MPSETLKIDRLAGERPRIVRLEGPLTLSTLFSFQELMRAEAAVPTILDLAAVPYVDSAGLGALVNAYVSHQRAGFRFVLVQVAPRVHTLLTVTKVDQLFTTFADLESARRELAQGN